MSKWINANLGDICDISIGRTPPRKERIWFSKSEGIPWISIADMGNANKYITKTKEYLTKEAVSKFNVPIIKKNTVILSFKMTVGRVAITDKEMLSNEAIAHMNNCKINTEFLYYYLKNFNYSSLSSTSSIVKSAVNTKILKNIPVVYPENKNDQEKISRFLSLLDEKIEINKKVNKTLEEIAKTLFKSWFIDFDPVRARAEKRPTGLSKEISDLFPDSFEDSELGEIPKGWKVEKIGTYFDVLLGGTPSRKKEEYWNGDIPWINSGEINNFRVISHSELITKSGFENSSTKLMPKRSTLIAITGATLGQVSLNEIEVCANQSVIGISPATSIFPEYVYLWIKFTIKKLISSQTGGAQQHINTGNVKDHLIMIPDENITNYFITFFESIFDKISTNLFENQTLMSLRDTLLPKLISGELTVSDAKNLIEEASLK